MVQTAGTDGSGHLSGHVMLGAYAGVLGSGVAFGALVDLTGTYAAGWSLVLALAGAALLLAVARGRLDSRRASDAMAAVPSSGR